MDKGRMIHIDIAKGIAIICIILGHLGVYSIDRVVFTFHVPIFFLITGFFVDDKRSISEFIKNKVRILLVPYALTCVAIIVLAVLLELRHGTGTLGQTALDWIYASVYGAGTTWQEPFYIKQIGALWFLWATFWGSIFLRILLGFSHWKRISIVIALFFAGVVSKSLFWFPFSIQAGACATLYMYMGYLFKQSKSQLLMLSRELFFFGGSACLMVWGAFIKNFTSFGLVCCDFGKGTVDILSSVCASICVLYISWALSKKKSVVTDALSYIGRYSLFVLCIHIIELNLFPWSYLLDKLVEMGMTDSFRLPVLIFLKLTCDLSAMFVLSKIERIKLIFGYKL